jgi:undecaprenyl-diphosphatase
MTGKPRHSRSRRTRQAIGFWDRLMMRRWRGIRFPARLQRALLIFVKLGDGWLWILVALLLWAVLPRDRFLHVAGNALLAACLSLPFYWAIKGAFRRSRPYTLFKWISPAVSPRDTYSFPSGHTMNNLSVAAVLAIHVPWLWPLALGIPVSMGLLRVFFGVHFLSDIFAGVFFGLLTALAAYALY